MQFVVFLSDDSDKHLRSGLHAELDVVYDTRDNVVRIPNGPYFKGPGQYFLFVKTGDNTLEKRGVILGDSNFDHVEVVSGIQPGEEVVVSDMSRHNDKSSIKIKN